MMNEKRYRLQRKEPVALPNVLGNRSMPVHTYRWKDIMACAEREPLADKLVYCAPRENYRIVDTMAALEGGQYE